jgi:BirA family transcriptional regulator, biotin operon repressor / biotin---[acetyl-CoA-carboxylase] ligase
LRADLPVKLDIVAETGSTNADLLARLSAGAALDEGYWLIADRQTAGRGRQGRPWLDGSGNFMGSTLVTLGPDDPSPASLSFVVALAVYAVVSGQIARPGALTLKWPNDLLLLGEKFCGILLQRSGPYVVVGIGVNLRAAPQLADRQATSLADAGLVPDRNRFAAQLAASMADELANWRRQGVGPVLARWQASAHRPGTRLTVHDGTGTAVSGSYDGLEPDGALRLVLDDGTIRLIHAGDVTQEGSG